MITVLVNGNERVFDTSTRAIDLVAALTPGDDHAGELRGVALALNGRVIPRGQWAQTSLVDGDRVEIVQAVQGG